MKRKSVLISVALLLLLLFGAIASACSADPAITLRDVKTGRKTAPQYLDYLSESMPEIKQLKEQGLIKAIIYNPSEDELKELLTNLIRDQGYADQLVFEVRNSIPEHEAKTVFQILPSHTYLFGRKTPLYIIFYPLGLDILQEDNDVRSVLVHEIQHVRDLYYGVDIGDRHLDWQVLAKDGISSPFWKNLMELRAYHQELYVFFSTFEKKKGKYGDKYIINTGVGYATYYFALQNSGATELEKEITKVQIALFSDIRALEEGKKIIIEANIRGANYRLELSGE